jgi:acyl-[acyl-carrier-protein]-phospholipid O-acyltransferase/long-chain-fatty-acid--[acyl-carrier-protein] ligase
MPLWIAVPAVLVARLLYRVRVLGVSHVPREGGAVLVVNHLSYMDVVVIQLACPRPLRFMAYSGPGTGGLLDWIFRKAGVITVSPHKPSQWLRDAVAALGSGELVCVFPEGAISRTGQLMAIRKGFEHMARRARVPVIPAAIDGLWGSVFSFSGNRYLWKSPRLARTPVCVAFGEPIPYGAADADSARRALMGLGMAAFGERPVLRRNIGREAVRALARRPGSAAVVDRTSGRRIVTAAELIAAAAVLSRHLRRTVPEARVGIVLPPGAGAVIANLAAVCAGKVPVNLNFTASRAAVESSLAESGVGTVLTADAMKARLPDFPWPARSPDLRGEMEAAGGQARDHPVGRWPRGCCRTSGSRPGGHPGQWAGTTRPRSSSRAGAAAVPKGVVLSHRNLLANFAQISSTSILPGSAW